MTLNQSNSFTPLWHLGDLAVTYRLISLIVLLCWWGMLALVVPLLLAAYISLPSPAYHTPNPPSTLPTHTPFFFFPCSFLCFFHMGPTSHPHTAVLSDRPPAFLKLTTPCFFTKDRYADYNQCSYARPCPMPSFRSSGRTVHLKNIAS